MMKIGPQVYVKGSFEAVERYCDAFGAKIGLNFISPENTYEHCELMINDQLFMAVSEAPDDCERTKGQAWQTTAFNVYEMGSEEAVRHAFEILSDGGVVIHPLGPCDWNTYCADIVDKFGVFWWIAI